MERMTEVEARQFIEECRSPAIATVVRENGRPHSTPIWIHPHGDEVLFTVYHISVKGKVLARDPRVTLVVQDDNPPYRYAIVEGRVTRLEDDLEVVKEWAGKLGGRYLGQDRAEEFAQRNGVPGELVARMTIDRIHGDKNITE